MIVGDTFLKYILVMIILKVTELIISSSIIIVIKTWTNYARCLKQYIYWTNKKP